MKFYIEVFRDTDVRFQFWLKSGKNRNTLHPSQVFCAKYVLEGKIFLNRNHREKWNTLYIQYHFSVSPTVLILSKQGNKCPKIVMQSVHFWTCIFSSLEWSSRQAQKLGIKVSYFLSVITQSFLPPEFIALHMYKYIFTYNWSYCYLYYVIEFKLCFLLTFFLTCWQ